MEKKRLKILAISDTHLGEDVSLLSYPQGLQHLWRELRNLLGYDVKDPKDQIEVEELIMIGDIPDRALSSTAEIMTATTNFVQMLGSTAKIKKGVYVPGNHDHTIWTDYIHARHGDNIDWLCTDPYEGEPILKDGSPIDLKSSENILATFFGYEYGSSWLKISQDKNFDFFMDNPLYSTRVGDRTYVFTHGSHFKREVTDPFAIKAIKGLDIVDGPLVGIDVISGVNVTRGCNSLEMLEEKVGPFLDSLWVSSKNIPTGKSDRYWYILKILSSFGKMGRNIPDDSRLFTYKDLKNNLAEGRIKKLNDGDIDMWRRYFLPHMVQYCSKHLSKEDLKLGDLTFVYGDTHIGGWGEFPYAIGGLNRPIRVYNTGGWTTHSIDDHPACHIFAVDIDGNEYMLDISFNKVKIGDEKLTMVAGRDAENSTILLRNNPIAREFNKKLTRPDSP